MSWQETNWQKRWEDKQTGWDLGGVTPVLRAEADKVPAGSRALVPGCGAAYDLDFLATCCDSVTGIDLAPSAVEVAKQNNKVRPHPR